MDGARGLKVATADTPRVERAIYSQSVHGQAEIDAVVEVLRGGPTDAALAYVVEQLDAFVETR
jgi:hypothetical protein